MTEQSFKVRFEARHKGAIGAFRALIVEITCADAATAVAGAREHLADKFELRSGGDVQHLADKCSVCTPGVWYRPDGTEAPMLLPCQTENIGRDAYGNPVKP